MFDSPLGACTFILLRDPSMALRAMFAAPATPPDEPPVQNGRPTDEERETKRLRTEYQLSSRIAGREDKFAECVIVLADPSETANRDTARMMRYASGRYFKIGVVGGSPAYRQDHICE